MSNTKENSSRPFIGIVNTRNDDNPEFIRSSVCTDYVQAVIKGGGIPVQIPLIDIPLDLTPYVGLCDGFLFPGDIDLAPQFYNEPCHEGLGVIHPPTDRFQLDVFNLVFASGKPILGICKGCQIINVALGGTLYQDLKEIPTTQRHYTIAPKATLSHRVTCDEDSPIARLLGSEFWVNSFHHQAIKSLGKGLKEIARAEDGVTEAIIYEGSQFVWGLQWHPEMMLTASDSMLPVMQAFIRASAADRASRGSYASAI